MGHGVKSMVRALSLAAVLGLCGGSAMAFQVAGGVDNAAVAAIALDAGQKAAVDKLVSDNLAGLSSAKAVDVMKSRRAILEPMMVPQVLWVLLAYKAPPAQQEPQVQRVLDIMPQRTVPSSAHQHKLQPQMCLSPLHITE